MTQGLKCLFCEESLTPVIHHTAECDVAYCCKTCGMYGFTKDFNRALTHNPERVRKWALENRIALLHVIREGNKSKTGLLLKSDNIGVHFFYAGSDRSTII